jgi:hypothetical protein
VIVGGMDLGSGKGYSKKESHQKAAKKAIKKLRNDNELLEKLLEKVKNESAEQPTTEEGVNWISDPHSCQIPKEIPIFCPCTTKGVSSVTSRSFPQLHLAEHPRFYCRFLRPFCQTFALE